jgi:hypothetical protein
LEPSVSGLDALETARKRSLHDLALVIMFERAAVKGNVSVIKKLQEAELHPLKRHDSFRLSEIVEDEGKGIGGEIKELVESMERAAIGLIWPKLETIVS